MSQTKLLPCPFCGSSASLRCITSTDEYYVDCDLKYNQCSCVPSTWGYDTPEEAIKAWNTRKPMERIVERLEEELNFADSEKKRCSRENPLQFDSAKGCAQGLYNAIEIVKEEGGFCD